MQATVTVKSAIGKNFLQPADLLALVSGVPGADFSSGAEALLALVSVTLDFASVVDKLKIYDHRLCTVVSHSQPCHLKLRINGKRGGRPRKIATR